MSFARRYIPLIILAAAIFVLYFYNLGGVGVLGPDEPRYAAIGRAMAISGDLITPRLWGSPWFEKPPLLYWMTAAGTIIGLGPEIAGRLPVAILSLAFLAAYFTLLRDEFGLRAAAVSAALLATSAGWIVFSGFCLTDLPLAVCFSMAMLLVFPLLRPEPQTRSIQWRFVQIGAWLGVAMLAKGLVPIALALPFLWFLRRFWRYWWLACLACLIVAMPWYAAMYAHNGYAFVQEFFLKHHLERLYSPSLQHAQPWYYYFPVLLAGMFPWTPLTGLLAMRGAVSDRRRRLLATVFVFGFLLFSVSLNKLPGYMLPLFPCIFALLGARFEAKCLAKLNRFWLLPCAVLIGFIPLLAPFIPQALSIGRIPPVTLKSMARLELLYIALPIAVIFLLPRSRAGVLLILCVVGGAIYLKAATYPILDATVSARGLWRELTSLSGSVCDGGLNREWQYGLAFYRDAPLPDCRTRDFDFAIKPRPHQTPIAVPLRKKAGQSDRLTGK